MNPVITSLIERGALFVVNHSGGKDSQAMLEYVRRLVPADQILVVHAHLPGVEWEGTEEHVRRYLAGLAYRECQSARSFLQMVRERKKFPSAQQRQCTSDLKRGPIERTIRHYLRSEGRSGLVVNCMGMRAQESPKRKSLPVFKYSQRNSKAGREWYDWLPIHSWDKQQVFTFIAAAGQQPHWAYGAGMTRLSCCFCIMASKADLTTAARLNPKLYAEYVQLEKDINHTLSMDGTPLEVTTGIKAS